jgi:hypothetical protein
MFVEKFGITYDEWCWIIKENTQKITMQEVPTIQNVQNTNNESSESMDADDTCCCNLL